MARFFGLAVLVWLLAWLPIGLWVGDPDYVLTRVSRDTVERQLYQILLYLGLLGVFLESWWRHRPPRPSWGKVRWLGVYFVAGLAATALFRGILWYAGFARWSLAPVPWWQVAGGCLAVAFVEEALFRGFLLGTLVKRYGWTRGAWLTSAIFAAVHLFRPGDAFFKLGYALGLLLLGYLLALIAWNHDALFASVGFHAGIILLNIGTRLVEFHPSPLSGWRDEPVAGALDWILTLGLISLWQKFPRRQAKDTE